MNIIAEWLIRKSLVEDMRKLYPLANMREISFGLLHIVPEVYI